MHLERAAPHIKETFEAIQAALDRIGPHTTVPVKTMILFRAMANFGGAVIRRETIDIEFVSPRPLSSARIRKSQQLAARRYSHHVRLTSPKDVDRQLAGWLREAYEMVSRDK